MSKNINYPDYVNSVDLSNNIYVAQIEQIYDQTPISLMGPIFGAVITAAMLNDYIDISRTAIWLCVILLSFSLYLKPWYGFKKTGVTLDNVKKLGRKYIVNSWIATASWGTAGFIMFSSESMYAQLILTMSIIVSMSAIMSSSIIYKPVFFTILAITAPLIVRLLIEGEAIHYYIALGCASYSVMLFFWHGSLNKSMVKSLRLQFENELLAADLNVQKKRADRANMDKSKFLAAVSHDLRQPLHAHSLFFGELQYNLQDQTIYNDLLAKLNMSLESIGELFDVLLDLSKLEAGAIKPDMQSFYLQELISPIENEYNVKCKNSGLEFRVVKSSCIIRSDKILLSRIIRNLLENALKHSVSGKILLGCRRKKDKLSIQIIDNGEGISENEQKFIFDEYYQISQKNNHNNIGFGLGLSVVKEQCKLLNHSLTLSSIVGKGSSFSIEVSLSSEKFVSEEKTTFADITIDDLQDLNVVVIDDDISIQDAMTGILKSWGCNVIIGASAEEVISLLSVEFVPDVILSDYNLNEFGTGFEAINLLREATGKQISAAIITGDTSALNMAELREKKYPLLQKPVNVAKLRTLLRFLKTQ